MAALGCSTPYQALFTYGARQLDDDWSPPTGHLPLIGIGVALQPEQWPIGVEFGVQGGWKEEQEGTPDFVEALDNQVMFGEGYIGALKTLVVPGSPVRYFVGGGLTYTYAEHKIRDKRDPVEALWTEMKADGSSMGFYLHGGLRVRLGAGFDIGAELRYTGATDMALEFKDDDTGETLLESHRDVDGLQYGFLIGWDRRW